MKTKYLVLVVLVLGSFCTMNAQAYKSAIGVKGGNVALGSFKTFLGEKLAVEGVAGFGIGLDADLYGAVYLQMHFPIGSVDNLTWFAGVGPNLATSTAGTGLSTTSNWGLTGIGGADYRFGDGPINVSLDVSTPIYFGDSVFDFVPYFSAAIRYIFGDGGSS